MIRQCALHGRLGLTGDHAPDHAQDVVSKCVDGYASCLTKCKLYVYIYDTDNIKNDDCVGPIERKAVQPFDSQNAIVVRFHIDWRLEIGLLLLSFNGAASFFRLANFDSSFFLQFQTKPH